MGERFARTFRENKAERRAVPGRPAPLLGEWEQNLFPLPWNRPVGVPCLDLELPGAYLGLRRAAGGWLLVALSRCETQGVPIHVAGGKHDRGQDDEESERADQQGVVLNLQQDVETAIQACKDGSDYRGALARLKGRKALEHDQTDNRGGGDAVGRCETQMFGE